MDQALAFQVLDTANRIYARSNDTSSSSSSSTTTTRPAVYKVIGISLAVGSGAFIGTSFVLKKLGLLKANEKYHEVAGEGYGYLKNAFWWGGMTLMIIGEICNFVAYAFTDAILVTPLGALSVVITTVLSAIFLKERLSMVGKVACFLCIVGSVVIVMNAPEESSVSDIQEMQHYVIQPGFLSYAGVIIVGSIATAFYAGPRWGNKNMLVYLSICSWVGGLSVVATQGLGSAIVAQVGGESQFNKWFLYVLLVFVICTLVTEIIFLNKALNLFNAAMVTPTYYVYFTTTTIITSAILFQGFKGTATSIVTVVNGFLVICSGVVLLQLSKSAKDVPDTAVFSGNLDQIQTIAEQEQSETEPKADAIRGAAALVRRFSSARQNMEVAELKRLHEEKMRERLEVVSEDGSTSQPQYEWDGIRRRRTTMGSSRSRPYTATSAPFTPPPNTLHPPLGWSHVPTDEELAANNRPTTPGMLSSIAGTIRGRRRSVVSRGGATTASASDDPSKVQSPMHPVQLTEISVTTQHVKGEDEDDEDEDGDTGTYYSTRSRYGLPGGKTEYVGASAYAASSDNGSSLAPDPPPHSARRQFSFQNVFRRHQTPTPDIETGDGNTSGGGAEASSRVDYARRPLSSRGFSVARAVNKGGSGGGSTEEERLGLVKGDSHSNAPSLPPFEEENSYDEDEEPYVIPRRTATATTAAAAAAHDQTARYGRGITGPSAAAGSSGSSAGSSPPRRHGSEKSYDSGSSGGGGGAASTVARAGSFATGAGGGIQYDPHQPPRVRYDSVSSIGAGASIVGGGSGGGSGSGSGNRNRSGSNQSQPPPSPPGGRRYNPPRGGGGGNAGAFI